MSIASRAGVASSVRAKHIQSTQAPRIPVGEAVVAEVLNPKSAMFFLAFLPQFVKPANGAVWLQLMQLGALFVLAGLLCTTVLALGGCLRRHRVIARWQGKLVGSVYCALGARVATQER